MLVVCLPTVSLRRIARILYIKLLPRTDRLPLLGVAAILQARKPTMRACITKLSGDYRYKHRRRAHMIRHLVCLNALATPKCNVSLLCHTG